MEAGHYPDMVLGSSSGALNAAALAADPTLAGARALAWGRARRRDVFPLSALGLALAVAGRSDHLVSSARLGRWLSTVTRMSRVEDGVIALSVVATDLGTGREVLIERGPLVPALLASTAIPGLSPPVRLDGRWLVDGSVAMDSPIGPAVEAGANDVWALPGVPALETGPRRARSAWEILLRSSGIMIARQHEDSVRRWEHRCRLHVLPFPRLRGAAVSAFTFGHSAELVAAAYRSTRDWLDQGGAAGQGSRAGSS